MKPLYERDDVVLYHARWEDVVEQIGEVDLLCVDAPYSDRTHSGHNRGVADANKGTYAGGGASTARRELDYDAWGPLDVRRFCEAWLPRTRGWSVSITDHVLMPWWEREWQRAGRYTFPPVAFVDRGASARLCGGGPSSYTMQVSVSRPRNVEFARWPTTSGDYVVPPGHHQKLKGVTGGKPLWLLLRILEDYSRPGDLVCDPCAGAGTAGRAALELGRRAILIEQDEETAHLAAAELARPVPGRLFDLAGRPEPEQLAIAEGS